MKQELIERYVAERLGEQEAADFEAYCVANPDFARQVEFEQRLKAGIAQVARGSTAEFVRSSNLAPWKFAAAACALLAMGAIFYAWQKSPGLPGNVTMAAVTTDAQHKGATLRLALVRGAEATPTLAPGQVRVEIIGLFESDVHYRIVLERLEKGRDIETLATLEDQHATSPVTLEVMIDSDRLRAGAYSLQVRKQASDEEPLDFGFVKE